MYFFQISSFSRKTECATEYSRGFQEQTTTATTMTTTTTATTTATTTIPIPTLDFTDNRLANDVPKNITMTGAGCSSNVRLSLFYRISKVYDFSECSDLFFVLDSSGNVLEQYEKQKLHISNILMQLDDSDRHVTLPSFLVSDIQSIQGGPLPRRALRRRILNSLIMCT